MKKIPFADLILSRSHINGELAELPADAVAEWKLEAALNQKPWRNQPTHDSEPFHLCCLPVKVDVAGLAGRWRKTNAVSDLSEEHALKEKAVSHSGSKCRCSVAAVLWAQMFRMVWLGSRCSACSGWVIWLRPLYWPFSTLVCRDWSTSHLPLFRCLFPDLCVWVCVCDLHT